MDFVLPYHSYQARYPTKYMAFYHALKEEIRSGRLPFEAKLPSSRELAAQYQISRGTVNQVYEMLMAEGYVVTETGKGSFVGYNGAVERHPLSSVNPITLSKWGAAVQQMLSRESARGREGKVLGEIEGDQEGMDAWPFIHFDIGQPDLRSFPREAWNRCMYEQVRRMTDSPLQETYVAEGHYELREAIALHLRRTRGIDTPPSRIVIVNGSMQAIALLTQILVDPGDPVIVESPGYPGPGRAVQAAGGTPIPAEVDEQGLVPQPWRARLLFATPSRQFPTGAVLGLDRRQQLLRWAAEQNAVVVEDDYDSEFRHRGRPLEPLKVLDQEGRVVYIGTFSKTMRLDLRIGYIVLPDSLHDAFVAAKRLYEPHPSGLLEQRTLAAFMASGAYARHLRRMRRVYAGKFHLLRDLLQESGLSTLFEWVEGDAGLHLFGWWRGDARTYAAYAAACAKAGVAWADASSYQLPRGRCGACLGFSHLSEEEMREGVARLRRAWKE